MSNGGDQRFGRAKCHRAYVLFRLLDPEDGDTTILLKLGNSLPVGTEQ